MDDSALERISSRYVGYLRLAERSGGNEHAVEFVRLTIGPVPTLAVATNRFVAIGFGGGVRVGDGVGVCGRMRDGPSTGGSERDTLDGPAETSVLEDIEVLGVGLEVRRHVLGGGIDGGFCEVSTVTLNAICDSRSRDIGRPYAVLCVPLGKG